MSQDAAVRLALKSLWEAADSDSATGGPDTLRGIYPIVASITANGWERIDDSTLSRLVEELIAEHQERNQEV
jgi:proteasome beta subunit